MKTTRTGRYPIIDGKYALEIKVQELRQLFDERDPAPFRQKDLDDDAADYMVSCFRDLPQDPEMLVIYAGKEIPSQFSAAEVTQALHDFFQFEAERTQRQMRFTLQTGLRSLLIGFSFLTLFSFISYVLRQQPESIMINMVKETIYLLELVSMWRPVQIFLYEWWPYIELKNIYLKLAKIKVVIQASGEMSALDDTAKRMKAVP